MTHDLQSFLIAVGVIVALALLVPSIETLANYIRLRRNPPSTNPFAEPETQSSFSR